MFFVFLFILPQRPGLFCRTPGWRKAENMLWAISLPRSDVKKSWVQELMTSQVEWKIVIQVGGLNIVIFLPPGKDQWRSQLPLVVRLSWPLTKKPANLGRGDRHRFGLPTMQPSGVKKGILGWEWLTHRMLSMIDMMVGKPQLLYITTSLPLWKIRSCFENNNSRDTEAWKDNDQNKRFTMQWTHPHH